MNFSFRGKQLIENFTYDIGDRWNTINALIRTWQILPLSGFEVPVI